MKKFSSFGSPKCFSSKNSQCKNKKIKNIPPPESKIGAAISIDSFMCGSLLKVAVRASIGPKDGFTAQTISHGSNPRIKKTAKSKPQNKNHFLAFACIVERTSAFITALSMLEIASKRQRPRTITIIVVMLILRFCSFVYY